MKYSKWIGLAGVALLVFACTQTWIIVLSKNLVVTGLSAEGTNFGKPGLMNVIVSTIAAIFFLVPKVWAKRSNLFLCAFNIAWAIRNYIIVTMCRGGECPEKGTGIYLLQVAAVLMLVAAFFPDLEIKEEKK